MGQRAAQVSPLAAAWQVMRAAVGDAGTDLFTTAAVNLLWIAGVLLLLTGPPATVALFYVANRQAHGEATDPADYLRAARRFFAVGWRWGLLNGAVIFFLVGDVIITGRLAPPERAWLFQSLYLAATAGWLLLQLVSLPFLFEQERPVVRQALRNGVVMIGRNLTFTVALAVLLVAGLAISAVLFLVLFAAGAPILALIGNHAVLNRLAVAPKEQPGG
jgi:hypothetical protein